MVPHAVQTSVLTENKQHFSARQLSSHEILLLFPSHITVLHRNTLNPTTLSFLPEEGETHDCLTSVRKLSVP